MSETIQNGFGPLVALLTSQNVDAICAKNRLTFADLLAPFCTVTASVKDPNGIAAKANLRINVRDIQRHGFLLTLTALPHVLREAVNSVHDKNPEAWTSAYQESLFSWYESSNHEFLRTYLCAMFVISAHESNPLGELSRLVQLQYAQQHGSGDNYPNLGPRHCADPSWFMPNILKYYVMVYDVSVAGEDDTASQELFSSMCKTYGDKNCHFLKINSGVTDVEEELEDRWAPFLESRYRGLEAGLASARKSLLEKSESLEGLMSPLSASSHHSSEPRLSSPISTVSSSVRGQSPIFSTSNHGLSIPSLSNSIHENGGVSLTSPLSSPIMEATSPTTNFDFSGVHGQMLSKEDRMRIFDMVADFVENALVPFAQKQMRYLSENLNGRRGLMKSVFSGMKKWVGSSSTGHLGATPMTYPAESGEMQLRRLADMAFLFGLYVYAYPIYHGLRKDFAADQAWLYHAGASEMAAISKYLMDEQSVNFKDFPLHYLTSAMDYYNTCGQNLLTVRSALVACIIYQAIGANEKNPELRRPIYKDCSSALIRLTSTQSDLESAVLLERASDCFAKGGLVRKMAFHFILAGHRFLKAGLKEISLECYQKALPQIVDRQWNFAEDHMLYTLGREPKSRGSESSDGPQTDTVATVPPERAFSPQQSKPSAKFSPGSPPSFPIRSKPAPITLADAAKDLSTTLNLQSLNISNDFMKNRFCSFAVRLSVENVNPTLRDIWVTVNCGPIDSAAAAESSSGVASILRAVAVATVSSQQALIPQQAKLCAKIAHGSSHSFVIRLRATSPFVYDLTSSIRASVSFDADPAAERVPLSLPLTYYQRSPMASQTQGIQKLLAAEKRAAEKINDARKRKALRLKQAKQEAQAEIEKYRQEREHQFKDYEQKYLGTKGDIEAKIREDTNAQLETMQRSVAQNKQAVIVRLLQLVCDIRPELHHNLTLQKQLQGQFA